MASKRTPLNYLGNKSRVAKQINSILPKNLELIVEPFAGSAVISLNSNIQNIVLIDSNYWTIELLKYFSSKSSDEIINETFEIINEFQLSTYKNLDKTFKEANHEGYSLLNKEGYNQLKKSFNDFPKVEKLFVLIIYGFNHYIRFNNANEFNVPIGKGHFYKDFENVIKDYSNLAKNKTIKLINDNYKNFNLSLIKDIETTLFYIDPPYLITTAPYNTDWNIEKEIELYNWIEKEIHKKGIKFVLSNVIEANGTTNTILKKWIKKNNFEVVELNRKYENSNYRKKNKSSKEIIIKNFS